MRDIYLNAIGHVAGCGCVVCRNTDFDYIAKRRATAATSARDGRLTLRDAAEKLRDHLLSLEGETHDLAGLDIPDEVWIPFCRALDSAAATISTKGEGQEQ